MGSFHFMHVNFLTFLMVFTLLNAFLGRLLRWRGSHYHGAHGDHHGADQRHALHSANHGGHHGEHFCVK